MTPTPPSTPGWGRGALAAADLSALLLQAGQVSELCSAAEFGWRGAKLPSPACPLLGRLRTPPPQGNMEMGGGWMSSDLDWNPGFAHYVSQDPTHNLSEPWSHL